jgi:hypothetical protein
MAVEDILKEISILTGATFATKQYYFGKVNSSGLLVTAGDGEAAIGVVTNNPASGEVASVAIGGIVKVVAGASITAGAVISSTSDGKAQTAASGDLVLGVALTAADNGDVFSMIFQPGHKV